MPFTEFKLFAEPEYASKKGVADGYAGLDSGGKVPVGQLPDSVTVGGMRIRGAWDPTSTDTAGSNPVFYQDETFRSPAAFNIGPTGDDVPAVGDFWVASDETVGTAYANGAVGGDDEIFTGDSIVITEVTEQAGQYKVVYQQIGGSKYVTTIGDQSGAIDKLNFDNLLIQDKEISGALLKDGEVTALQLGTGAVTADKIADTVFDVYNTPDFTNTVVETSSPLANLNVGYDATESQNYYLLTRGNVPVGDAVEVNIYMQMTLPARFSSFDYPTYKCLVSALVNTFDFSNSNGSVILQGITKLGSSTPYLGAPHHFVGDPVWSSVDATTQVPDTDKTPLMLHFKMHLPANITQEVRFYGARIRTLVR